MTTSSDTGRSQPRQLSTDTRLLDTVYCRSMGRAPRKRFAGGHAATNVYMSLVAATTCGPIPITFTTCGKGCRATSRSRYAISVDTPPEKRLPSAKRKDDGPECSPDDKSSVFLT
jgi:hypothetical protein